MAKVEQKVGLDPSNYTKNLNKLQKTNQQEMKRVSKEFDQTGDKIEDFTQGSKKNLLQLSNAFGDLFDGLANKIKGLNLGKLAAVGTALAAAVKGQAAIDRNTATAQGLSFQTDLNQNQTAGLQRRLFDVSSAANVDFEDVAQAVQEGVGRGAKTGDAIQFAEVASKLSRLSDQLDPRTAAEFIAQNLKARDVEINRENAREVADAIAVATRNGFKDVNEALSVLSEFDPVALQEAQLSNRDLVNMLGGLRTGVGVGREGSTSLLKELIEIQRGDVGLAEQFKGITGVQLRGQDGQFQLRREDLMNLNRRLEQFGDVRLRRQILKDTNLSEQGADALLALARNPDRFFQAMDRTKADTGNLDQAFEKATNTFTEKLSSGWNTFLNSLQKPLFVIDPETGAVSSVSTDFDSPKTDDIFKQAAGGARPPWLQKGPDTATDPSGEQKVKVEVEVNSVDPGFVARPKATDQFRTPGGF